MFAKHGYALPEKTMSVRLVNLLDDSRRKELMFIYSEDLATSGTTVNKNQWPQFRDALVRRAPDRTQLVTN